MHEPRDIHDAIVIGAGPAGLTAAVYLGRFRRRCLVVEDGHSRARWIPTSHNIPGFAAGIGGETLLNNLKAQALQYGARIDCGTVTAVSRADGIFTLRTKDDRFYSRYVLLATGVREHLPEIEGAEEAVKTGLLRVCPICDAFEAIDKRIGVIGHGPLGEREAVFLTHYSDRVTLMTLGISSDAATGTPVVSVGFERMTIALPDIKIDGDRITVWSENGMRDFDVVYLALGCSPQHALANTLSAVCDEQGALRVNAHQETSVCGLYAAGDVVRGLNQIVVAAAESAIAATDIHKRLGP